MHLGKLKPQRCAVVKAPAAANERKAREIAALADEKLAAAGQLAEANGIATLRCETEQDLLEKTQYSFLSTRDDVTNVQIAHVEF